MAESKGNNIGNFRRRQRVSRQVRQSMVLTLKASGRSDRDIMAELAESGINVTHQTVNNDWHAGLDDRVKLSVDEALEIIKLQMHRIDLLLTVHFDLAMEGNLQSANIVIKLLAEQRTLLGLRKPEVILYQEETETLTFEEVQEDKPYDYSKRTDTDINRIIEFSDYLIRDAERDESGSEGATSEA